MPIDNLAISELVPRKHQQDEGHWPPPTRAGGGSGETDLALILKAVKDANPEVGVGPRGFRSNYAKASNSGRFADSMAKAAFANSEALSKHLLECPIPPCLRRQFRSGLLKPLAKAGAMPGETADARPIKAEDTETALWCQAPRCFHTPRPKNDAAAEGTLKHL